MIGTTGERSEGTGVILGSVRSSGDNRSCFLLTGAVGRHLGSLEKKELTAELTLGQRRGNPNLKGLGARRGETQTEGEVVPVLASGSVPRRRFVLQESAGLV